MLVLLHMFTQINSQYYSMYMFKMSALSKHAHALCRVRHWSMDASVTGTLNLQD